MAHPKFGTTELSSQQIAFDRPHCLDLKNKVDCYDQLIMLIKSRYDTIFSISYALRMVNFSAATAADNNNCSFLAANASFIFEIIKIRSLITGKKDSCVISESEKFYEDGTFNLAKKNRKKRF
ncbi:hypothetical protein BpHYR1_020153 [Brachionus plicatilis]|uniref:Uncharacterized protein n=1 Tax=Brachionus plicatilis TaxID=10195 RepID=A0A3M7PXH4_BRAPC|nr:hypothetical protein BpHYR1_020153 [Brachionus plicatilis]